FGCRIYPSGQKTYVFFYNSKGAVRKKEYLKIGSHGSITCDIAREIAKGWSGDIARGINLKEQKKKKLSYISFQDFFKIFTEKYRKIHHKENASKIDDNRLKKHILPFFGSMKINEINEKDILRFKDHLKHIPGAYNRSINLIRKAFNLAELWGYRPKNSNPCHGIPKYPEKKKERFLTNEELEKLDSILREQGILGITSSYSLAAIRMLMYTGCRLNEILTLNWQDVFLEEEYLHLKDSKTGEKTIPLNESAMNILINLQRNEGNPYVFLGKKPGTRLTTLKTAWNKIRRLAEIEDVRLHDLRHTFASLAIKQGVDLYTVSKLLGHRDIKTTTRYAHLEVKQLIKATNVVDQIWQKKRLKAKEAKE
ncbi:MAG: tyrosine-type recombinase/integrase, partial [Alphaproteobacteria bacterium]|nr:tyrosine-type recombinase/integrase [Alphaproteobacteria bacterium]